MKIKHFYISIIFLFSLTLSSCTAWRWVTAPLQEDEIEVQEETKEGSQDDTLQKQVKETSYDKPEVTSPESIEEIISNEDEKKEEGFSLNEPLFVEEDILEDDEPGQPVSATAVNNNPKVRKVVIQKGAEVFTPENITINVGDTVIWENKDLTIDSHLFQSVPGSNHYDKEKDEIILTNLYGGKTFSHTFDKIGTYPYFCFIHPNMKGNITVVKPGQSITQMKREVIKLTTVKKIVKSRNKLNAKEMVHIQDGRFVMGSPNILIEGPVRVVTLSGYYIDKYEVTNEEFEEFVNSTGYEAAGDWKSVFSEGFEKYPVTKVTYKDAESYAKWAVKRLPTEAEWEKAARGTDNREWPWGEEFDNEITNIFGQDEFINTAPVGSFEEDVSPFGVFDMSGNVSEWTNSVFLPYEGSQSTNNPEFDFNKKVIRGGSFNTVDGDQARTHSRSGSLPKRSFNSVGFRLVKDR